VRNNGWLWRHLQQWGVYWRARPSAVFPVRRDLISSAAQLSLRNTVRPFWWSFGEPSGSAIYLLRHPRVHRRDERAALVLTDPEAFLRRSGMQVDLGRVRHAAGGSGEPGGPESDLRVKKAPPAVKLTGISLCGAVFGCALTWQRPEAARGQRSDLPPGSAGRMPGPGEQNVLLCESAALDMFGIHKGVMDFRKTPVQAGDYAVLLREDAEKIVWLFPIHLDVGVFGHFHVKRV
jgi:hypothetical protein